MKRAPFLVFLVVVFLKKKKFSNGYFKKNLRHFWGEK
jgi:hypothetical protein